MRLKGLVKEAFVAGDLFDMACTEPSHITAVGSAHLDMQQSKRVCRSKVWCLAVEKPHLRLEDDLDSDADSNFSQQSRGPPGSWEGLLMNIKKSTGNEQTFVRIGTFTLYRHDWFDDCETIPLTIV